MKTMKKSMFVTTVLMVVLLVVALSTATFAWYTAQSTATVNETLVTSAASQSASLVIDDTAVTSNTANQTVVDIEMTGPISPAILNRSAAPTATTTLDDFNSFMTYTINSAATKYASTPASATVSKIQTVKGKSTLALTQDYFYVANVGGAPTGVAATVTINPDYYAEKAVATGASVTGLYTKNADGDYVATTDGTTAVEGTTYYELKANSFLRVAMFIGNDDDGYKYVGTWAYKDTEVDYTSVKFHAFDTNSEEEGKADIEGKALPTHDSYSATESGEAVTVISSLGSMSNAQVKLLAWFEGDSHTNAYVGTGSLFSVSFNGVAAA